MDGRRFDALTKTLGTPSGSRRRFLRCAAGGVAVALVPHLGRRGASADELCKPNGKKCRKAAQCCSGFCDPTTRTCGPCASHAHCDDRNACTVDLCGPTSHQCHHISISSDCVQCASDADCSGGSCCHGRCCPAGAGCATTAAGEPLCCPDCGGGVSCCDHISYMCSAQSCGYEIAAARCSYGQGNCASCPPLCTTCPAGYREVGAGGMCGVDNVCGLFGFCPVGGIF